MPFKLAARVAVLCTMLPGVLGTQTGLSQAALSRSETTRLDDLLDLARDRNPQLAAEALRVEAARLQAPQARALPEPSVGVTIAPFPVYTARGTQRSQWRLEQAIPYPGKRALHGELAELDAKIVEQEAAATAQDVFLRIKQAFYEVARARRQRQVIERFRGDLSRFEDIAATRYEVGAGSQQAILKAQLERAQLDVRLQKITQAERTAVEQIARLLDIPSTELQTDSLVLGPPPSRPADGTELFQRALAERPERQALTRAAERSRTRIALAEKAARPDFMVAATYFDVADGDIPMSADGRDALALTAGVKVPLWRGKIRAGIEQAEVERRRMQTRIREFDVTVGSYIDDLVHRLERQTEQLDMLENILIPQATSTREATLSAYTTGRATFLDLLDVERTLYVLHLDKIDTEMSRYQTGALLEQAAGIERLDTLN